MQEHHTSATHTKKALFDKISYCVLLCITFLTPIFFIPASFISTQFGTSLLFALGVSIVVLLYIISALFYGELHLPNPSKYILGFTALVPIVYTLAGLSNGFSRFVFFGYTFDITTVGFILFGFAYLFLVSIFFRTRYRIFHSYFAFVISSIIFAIFLILRFIFGPSFLSFGIFTTITTTMLGNWNNVGIFFGIGAILSLLTYEMVSVSRFMRVLLTIALLLSLFFLALVNFNLIWIIISICSFLFILYSVFSSWGSSTESSSLKQKIKKIPFYTCIVFIISVAFVIFGSVFGSYLSNKLHVTSIEARPTLSVTLDIARNTIRREPLFGSGPNSFTVQWLAWKPDDISGTIFWNTDFANGIGLIPTFAVTTGILGVLSWLLFLGFYVYLGIKSIFTKTEDSFIKYLITSSFFVSLYLWIMTFVYMPGVPVFILTLFFTGLFFGSVYLSDIVPVEKKVFRDSPLTGFVYSLILVAVFAASITLGYGLFQNSKSLWYFQKSSYALNTQNNITLSESYMKKAITAVPNDVYFRALSQIEILKLNAILSQDPKTVKPEEVQKQFSDTFSAAVTAGKAATDADPKNYLNWVAIGRVYDAVSLPALKVSGAYEYAQSMYANAHLWNPKNPEIYVLLSRLSLTVGDLKQAENYALQAIELKKNYLDAYLLLSQIEIQNKNITAAINSVTTASIIDPTNSGTFFQLGVLKYNNSDFTGAVEALEKAVSMTPDYANAKYFLGLSYESLLRHSDAIKQFEDIQKTNPDNTDLKTIITNLKAGEPIFGASSGSKSTDSKKSGVK